MGHLNTLKMKKLVFHSFISVLLFLYSCKTKDDFVAIDAKYEFLNYFFNLDSPIRVNECKFIADRDTTKIDTDSNWNANDLIDALPEGVFTQDDLDFIDLQLKEESRFRIDPARIKDRILIEPNLFKQESPENFWVKILEKYATYKFYSITMPIFSKDLSTVIIELTDYQFAAGKRIIGLIFKKEGGKWTLFEQLNYYD